jgi:hypothetical protein
MREIVLDYESSRHNEGSRGEKRADELSWVARRKCAFAYPTDILV